MRGIERFSCAAGPLGWRYASQRFGADGTSVTGSADVTVDARWRQLRVEVTSGGWQVRGGLTGSGLAWVRSAYDAGDGPARRQAASATEGGTAAVGFTGTSPAFLVATARLLSLDVGERRRLRLVVLSEPALAPLTVEQEWHLTGVDVHETGAAPLPVAHYEVDDRSTGKRAAVHLAGDVVLAAEGWYELELIELDAPPSLT